MSLVLLICIAFAVAGRAAYLAAERGDEQRRATLAAVRVRSRRS